MKSNIKRINFTIWLTFVVLICVFVTPLIHIPTVNSSEFFDDSQSIDELIDTIPPADVDSGSLPEFNTALECYEYAQNLFNKSTNVQYNISANINFGLGTASYYRDIVIDNKGYFKSDTAITVTADVANVLEKQSHSVIFNRFTKNEAYVQNANGYIDSKTASINPNNYKLTTYAKETAALGRDVDSPYYIINKSTIIKTEFFKKTSSYYSFKFVLDNKLSTIDAGRMYVTLLGNQLKMSYPVFNLVEYTAYVTLDGKFIKTTCNEVLTASASYGIISFTGTASNITTEVFKHINGPYIDDIKLPNQ